MKINNRAFTVIEVTIAVAVAILLSGIVINSILDKGKTVRDSQRMETLKALQYQIEKYKNDTGYYPMTSSSLGGTPVWWRGSSQYGWSGAVVKGYGVDGYIPDLVPDYIEELPEDPNHANNGDYLYQSNGYDYMLLSNLAVESINPCDIDSTTSGNQYHPMYRSLSCSGNLAVYSDGARTW